jgi:hypothetical protein
MTIVDETGEPEGTNDLGVVRLFERWLAEAWCHLLLL